MGGGGRGEGGRGVGCVIGSGFRAEGFRLA